MSALADRKTKRKEVRDFKAPTRRRSTRLSGKVTAVSSTKSSSTTSKLSWEDRSWKLFITSNTKVCVWDGGFCSTVFSSGSEGIVAAKRAKDGSVLAVADSQIVVLHKIEKGQQQSYRLKGAEGNCRLLQYAHDSRSLFFTDNIHYSVQTYSLKEDRVSEAAKAHPSPITTFTLSTDSNLLLSCSADPPIIHLHNRTLNTTIEIKPKASAKPVVCCAFHPTRKTIFLLAYADGVLAAYDSTRLIKGEKGRAAARRGDVGSGGGEHIHAFNHLHDTSIGGSGITGVEFIPGFRSRAVSVGEDGRLFILDFEKGTTLASWHVGAPATSLTIRAAVGKDAGKATESGWMVAIGTKHGRAYVFNGDGTKVCEQIVDQDGAKILDVEWVSGDIALPPGLGECAASNPAAVPASKTPSVTTRYPADSTTSGTISTLSSLPEGSGSEVDINRVSTNPPLLPEIPKDTHWQDVVETYTAGYMKLFSPVKKKRPTKAVSVPEKSNNKNASDTTDPKQRVLNQDTDRRSAISAPQLWDEALAGGKKHGPTPNPSFTSTGNDSSSGIEIGGLKMFGGDGSGSTGTTTKSKKTPQDNDDSNTRVDGNASRADSYNSTVPLMSVRSDITRITKSTDDGKLLSEIKSIKAKIDGGRGGGLALFAPYMPTRPARKLVKKSIKRGGSREPEDRLAEKDANSSTVISQEGNTVMADKDGVESKGDESRLESGSNAADNERPHLYHDNTINTTISHDENTNITISESDLSEPEADEEANISSADIWLLEGLGEAELKRTKNRRNDTGAKNKGADELSKKRPLKPSEEDSTYRESLSRSAKSRKTRDAMSPNQSTFLSIYEEEERRSNRHQHKNNMALSTFHSSNNNILGPASGDLAQVLYEMKAEIRSLHEKQARDHEEVMKQFQQQTRVLERMEKEMGTVKGENERLRRRLAEVMSP